MIKAGTLWEVEYYPGYYLYLETEKYEHSVVFRYRHWFIGPKGEKTFVLSAKPLGKSSGIVQVK